MVAPGLCSRYAISFVPETLADCDDELVVQTDGFCDVIVPLQARRPPPVLTLQSVIHAGHCLVGGAKLSTLTFKNEGGDGSFFILPKSKWPATGYKNFLQGRKIVEAPFEIRPAMFFAPSGSTIPLEILFLPKHLGEFDLDILFVCDNCHVKKVKIVGISEEAKVELSKVSDDALIEPAVGEPIDPAAQKFLKFPNINPMTYAVRKLSVKNLTQVAMNFSWQIMKPFLVNAENEASENEAMKEESRKWDVSSPFSISPNSAEIPAGGTTECSVVFAAPYPKSFHNLFQLVLHNIPKAPENVENNATVPKNGKISKKGVSDMKSGSNSLPIVLKDEIGMVLDVKGECIPYNVCFVPYCIDFAGKTLLGTTVRRPLQIMNNSLAPVYFRWQPVTVGDNEVIEIEPSEGEIAEGYWASLEVAISSNAKPGLMQREINCEIEHQEKQLLSLKLTADIEGPTVKIVGESVHFGLVKTNDVIEQKVKIRNCSSIAAHWTFELQGAQTQDLVATIQSSTLAPLGEFEIPLQYRPTCEGSLNVIGHLIVQNGSDSFIKITGEAQSPTICFINCEEDLGNVFVGVPVSKHVQIFNQTELPTEFYLGEPMGDDCEKCTLKIFPTESIIKAKQTLEVEFQFMSNKLGNVHDLYVPCYVRGRQNPIWLSIKAEVTGLNVEYKVMALNEDGQQRFSDAADFSGGSLELRYY